MQEAKLESRERFCWFHWQNLNETKKTGGAFREGRCWWHFRGRRTIEFDWSLWTHFCMLEVDIDDEDLTFHIGFPPVAFWFSFSTNWWLISRFAPRKVLSSNYPDTIVIDERECGVSISGGTLRIKPWCKSMEWVKSDPWWMRGVSLSVNPFELKHISHEVRRADGSWAPYVGTWEHEKDPDARYEETFPYRYVLKNGDVQERTATVYVDRMEWRPRCLRWTRLFRKVRTSIDVTFSDEVGERTGSWKGGTTGCGYELRSNESAEECLRRMESERKF
jgi:hypothetical protein